MAPFPPKPSQVTFASSRRGRSCGVYRPGSALHASGGSRSRSQGRQESSPTRSEGWHYLTLPLNQQVVVPPVSMESVEKAAVAERAFAVVMQITGWTLADAMTNGRGGLEPKDCKCTTLRRGRARPMKNATREVSHASAATAAATCYDSDICCLHQYLNHHGYK
ncbi:hypothetical protein Emed_003996 [Eimeria media]